MRKMIKKQIQAALLSVTLVLASIASPVSVVNAATIPSQSMMIKGFLANEPLRTKASMISYASSNNVDAVVTIEDEPIVTVTSEAVVEEPIVEPVVESPNVNVATVETQSGPVISLTEEEVRLIALLTMAEAEGESELGKRLVIDTVLNRVVSDRHANTVSEVVYSGAYVAMHNGRSDRCYVREDICQLVREEAVSRTHSRVLYFRTGKYHSFGTPEIHEGSHYFSS